jgi:hypothetical protein
MPAVHKKELGNPTMNFVVFPTQALCDPDSSPLMFCKKTKNPRVIRTKIILWNHLQELFGKNDMAIFIFVVRITV